MTHFKLNSYSFYVFLACVFYFSPTRAMQDYFEEVTSSEKAKEPSIIEAIQENSNREETSPSTKFTIDSITPIQAGMNEAEARKAIISFLKQKEVFSTKNFISLKGAQIETKVAPRPFKLFTLGDKTQWVQAEKEGGLGRFLGARHLDEAIQAHSLKQFKSVESKVYMNSEIIKKGYLSIKIRRSPRLKGLLLIDSEDFFTFSRYIGDKRPVYSDILNNEVDLKVFREKTGFFDFPGNANLRFPGGKFPITGKRIIKYRFVPIFKGQIFS